MYIINRYTGNSIYWRDVEQSDDQIVREHSRLWEEYIPEAGPAETLEAEMFRMANRIVYDIFNNGLCNDKREECRFLLTNAKILNPHLESVDSLDWIVRLLEAMEERETPNSRDYYGGFYDDDQDYEDEEEDDNEWPTYDADQSMCDALDDIVSGTIKLMLSKGM